MLLVRVQRMSVRVAVNGVPLLVEPAPTTLVFSRELSAVRNALDNVVSAKFAGSSPDASFGASVFRNDNGAVSLLCSASGDRSGEEVLTFFGSSGEALEGSDDPPDLDPETRIEILGRLTLLHRHLTNGDADAALGLLSERIDRRSNEIGLSTQAATDTQRRTVETIVELRDSIEPLSPDHLEFHLVRDGQEVLVCRPDGRGPIAVSTPSTTVSLRPSFARLESGWAIVR